ncbi:MAG: hypothetical protein M3O71_15410 [Bacteroidota bacterium]|nr:hypothetical protein [Bacteroidota bacterium]
MTLIVFNSEIIYVVRDAVWKVADPEEKPGQLNGNVARKIAAKYPVDGDINVKLASCFKVLPGKKGASAKSEAYRTFINLCNFLGAKIVRNGDGYIRTPLEVIDRLLEMGIINEDMHARQKEKWNVNGALQVGYYACYYSRGNAAPDVAWLYVNFKELTATLKFFRDIDSTHKGNVRIEPPNVFITLENDSNHYQSLLSVMPTRIGPISEAVEFDGFYCSALDKDKGKPVAGRIKIIKKKPEERYQAAEREIPALIAKELYFERLIFRDPPVSQSMLDFYKGVYEGFWFWFINNQIEIRRYILDIREDGRCVMTDEKGVEIPGQILQLSEDNFVLKCGFDAKEDTFNFRFQLFFDIEERKSSLIDGVFSGQRMNAGLISGKTRLYAAISPLDKNAKKRWTIEELRAEMPDRAEDIIQFFYGMPNSSDIVNVIQPNFEIFNKGQRSNDNLLASLPGASPEYDGDYILHKLDYTKKWVDRYDLKISENSVLYTLKNKEDDTVGYKYQGIATFYKNCLMLNILSRNNTPHNALYSFHIGAQKSSLKKYYSGVYATMNSEGATICGRAVLKVVTKPADSAPVLINSEEYYQLDKTNLGLMKFLTGPENNLIKPERSENKFARNIDYSEVFFSYACNSQAGESKQILYIKYALEQGFTDAGRLRNELKPGKKLQSLTESIRVDDIKNEDSTEYTQVIIFDETGKEEIFQIFKSQSRK